MLKKTFKNLKITPQKTLNQTLRITLKQPQRIVNLKASEKPYKMFKKSPRILKTNPKKRHLNKPLE